MDDGFAQTRPIASFDPSFQQVDGGFIAAVDVWLGSAARWDDYQVHR